MKVQVDMETTVRWHDVMPLDELWIGELIGVEAGGQKIVILNAGGEVRAYEDRCPHLSSLLSEGDLDGTILTCSTHLWEFDCLTGAGVNPRSCGLKAHPVRIEDGTIYVGVEDVVGG
jgi:toluene monooxygenase system ferredoxin subunit